MSELSHIVVAEEDADYAFILRLALEEAGVGDSTHFVDNPSQVIAYLSGEGPFANRQLCPLPALILLCLRLPMLTGFDILSWIRAHPEFRHIRVVVLSGAEFPNESRVARQLGADYYAVKPFDFDHLVTLAKRLRRKWLHRARRRDLAA